MRWLAFVGLLFCAPALHASEHRQDADAEAPIVVVISMDGLRWDYPDHEPLPAFTRIKKQGARAQRLTPVFPSTTFPGHVSMATGTTPDIHGIVDNSFVDEVRGSYRYSSDANWLRAEPIWIAAERQGVKAATYFWVGSETDWRGQGTSYRIAPFDGTRPEALKVAQILEWLRLPGAQRPHLIMSYFAGTDGAGHNFGPDSSRVNEQLVAQDAQLGSLLAGIDELDLWHRLTLIVVSDHGMIAAGDHVALDEVLADAGIEAKVTGFTVGHVWLASSQDAADAAEVLARDSRLKVVTRAQAQAGYTFAATGRTGDLVVIAQPPVVFEMPGGFRGAVMGVLRFFGWDFGAHGYDPDIEEMGGVFLALGRGVPEGHRLGAVRQVDVAPTIASLLGIQPPLQATGKPIELKK